ncbi:MAG: hypothetical protein KU38_06045 [Sulfurovum sp. FS08-3]|nr:MAG: hypothetical protein KU38_06045 [Sulfurovum sp. FS08-3]
MKYSVALLSALAALTITSCGGGGGSSTPAATTPEANNTTPTTPEANNTTPTTPEANNTTPETPATPSKETITGQITENKTLTADKVWVLNGKVEVMAGATLTIQPGTTVVGGTGTNAWLIVYPGATLMAEGTADKKITFTSEDAFDGEGEAAGQWGGVTIVGNDANDQTGAYEVDDVTVAGTSKATSGSLKHIVINNTGVAVEQDKEINGLSLFGVSNTTTVENITVNRSGDDGVEIWGGSVNLTNVTIDGAQDDSFDTDSGWSGTVDGLTITNGKKAGIEMSGTTTATYKNVSITLSSEDSEGGLYFKAGDGEVVGGTFEKVTVAYNATAKGAIAVSGDFDETKSSFTNVTLTGSNPTIVAKSDADVAEMALVGNAFQTGTNNTVATEMVLPTAPTTKETISGQITTDKTLTADKTWVLSGKVEVMAGATLTVEPGTVVAGGTGTNAWLIVYSGAKLVAEGTFAKPILFTSEDAVDGEGDAAGQWGGVSIIGNDANDQTGAYEVDDKTTAGTSKESSGSLNYVVINNTGIAVEQDKEINGLSLFGVSSATTVSNILVNHSGDDGVEIWGGSVNLTNVKIDGAQDDSFDTDSGWNGAVNGLMITNGKKAGIEMSGTTVATYRNVNITLDSADSEGGLYFKAGDGEAVGGIFEAVTVTYNSTAKGAIAVSGDFDETKSSFTNVTLAGSNPKIVAKTEADAAETALVETKFTSGTGNTK